MIFTSCKKILPLILLVFVFAPEMVFAHQPRTVDSRQTVVTDPEVSKAYYGQLTGVPDVYTIRSTTPFHLYINILVPDVAGQTKDVSVTVVKDGSPLTILDGTQFSWKQMFEPFGYDMYWAGPEYTSTTEAGTYVVTVMSPNNDSKYSLAIGETESFNAAEIINALKLVPQLKRSFFNESPISFIRSPFGWGLILSLYLIAGIVGFLYRFILRRMTKNTVRQVGSNIGPCDRLIRLVISVALLLWAITTTWSVVLIFLSGFALFEAVFSWCGLYAALGKHTCQIS